MKVFFVFFLSLIFIFSCVEPYSPTGEENPSLLKIVSVSPENLQENIALEQGIEVVFSKEVDKNTVNAMSFRLLQGEHLLDGDFTFSEDLKTVRFMPSQSYFENKEYVLILSRSILDIDGIPLYLEGKDAILHYSFKTEFQAPEVETVSIDASQSVSVNGLNEIKIKFSEKLLPESVNKGNIFITNAEGSLSYNEALMEVTYLFDAPLLAGYQYKLIITKNIKDLSGIEMLQDNIISFNTIE